MDHYLYGIDFGTTNSVLSIYDERKNEIIETISIPSLLYFPYDQDSELPIQYFVGNRAISSYLSDGMRGRFMKSIKRVLSSTSFIETRIHNQNFTASDLVALIIKELKNKADKIIDFDCRKAVIGRPVFFDNESNHKDELAQKRLNIAVKKAGFENVKYQFEPIGAAFAYEKTIAKSERVLVADFGGGTTDFTYIILDPHHVGKKDRRSDIIASGGLYIGGDSFDSAFMWEKGTPNFGKGVEYQSDPGKFLALPASLFTNICSWEKMNFFNGYKIQNELKRYYAFTGENASFKNLITLTENNLGYSVFQAIEKTKIDLSHLPESVFCYSNMEIEINQAISIDEYNRIIEKDLKKIDLYADQFLKKNNIHASEIDTLYLTGGTSLVVAINKLFSDKFPNATINSNDNFISVAKGLAYSGYLFE